MAQMDKVTQQNAANAEESASASEELNAQATQMNTAVNELIALVSGKSSHTKRSSNKSKSVSTRNTTFAQKTPANANDNATAEELIPMGSANADTDFSDF